MCVVKGSKLYPPLDWCIGWKYAEDMLGGRFRGLFSDFFYPSFGVRAEAHSAHYLHDEPPLGSGEPPLGFHFYFTKEDAEQAVKKLHGYPYQGYSGCKILKCKMEEISEIGMDGTFCMCPESSPFYSKVGIAKFCTILEVEE